MQDSTQPSGILFHINCRVLKIPQPKERGNEMLDECFSKPATIPRGTMLYSGNFLLIFPIPWHWTGIPQTEYLPSVRTTSKHQKMGSERVKKSIDWGKTALPLIESGDEGTRYGLWKGGEKILTFYRLWTTATDCCRRRSVGYITCWADSTIPMMASAVSQITLDEVL